jgi:hypothetical protein
MVNCIDSHSTRTNEKAAAVKASINEAIAERIFFRVNEFPSGQIDGIGRTKRNASLTAPRAAVGSASATPDLQHLDKPDLERAGMAI